MSRSGEQHLLEFATVGRFFSDWVFSDKNQLVLAEAINKAIVIYEKQRIDRVNTCGIPFPPSVPPFAVSDDKNTEKRAQQESVVSVVTEKIGGAVVTATTTMLNYGRLFCATVADKILSNSLEKFKERFPVVTAENARLAFLNIGRLSNGWEPEGHNGIGRASLSTLILVSALDAFVKDCDTVQQRDSDKDEGFVDVYLKPKTKGDVDPRLAPLEEFLACYRSNYRSDDHSSDGRSKEKIDPLELREQAKLIFLAFAATDPAIALSRTLTTYLEQQSAQSQQTDKKPPVVR